MPQTPTRKESIFGAPPSQSKGFDITDKRSGKTYIWKGPTPPTRDQARKFIYNEEHKSTWTKLNEPLSDLPSRTARRIAEPIYRFGESRPAGAISTLARGAGAFTESLGNVGDSMTSLTSLGLMGLTGGAGVAARVGAPALSTAATTGARAVGGAQAGHGLYKIGTADSLGDVGAGALETGLGVLGMRTPYRYGRSQSSIPPEGPNRFQSEGLTRQPRTPAVQRMLPGKVENVIDAEFTVNPPPPPPPAGLPPINNRGLPPARPTYYGGQYGVGTDIDAVNQQPRSFLGTSDPLGAGRGTPQSFSAAQDRLRDMSEHGLRETPQPPVSSPRVPNRDILEQNSPYGMGYLRSGSPGARQATPLPDMPEAPSSLSKVKQADNPLTREKTLDRPFAKMSDGDTAFLAEMGDKAAIAEARLRPNLWASLKAKMGKLWGEETGSIKFQNPFGKAGASSKAQDPFERYKPDFENWVNARRATKIEGKLKEREFKDLDSLGLQGIFDFQGGVTAGKLKDVAKYFDNKFAELSKGGVKLDYRENYLPQLWEEDAEKVFEITKRLGLKPSFALKRVLENYRMGIEAGLTPKYKTVSELIGWYEGRANKALADRKFFDTLADRGWISPRGRSPEGWETLDPDHFPVQKFHSTEGEFEKVFVAPPEIARSINNYLRVPKSELDARNPGAFLQWAADKASLSKNFAMSSGAPWTGVNAHGFNIMARTIIANPKNALTVGRYLFDPSRLMHKVSRGGVGSTRTVAQDDLDAMLHTAPWAIKRGLTLTTEGHELGVSGSTNLAGKAMQGFLKKQGEMFEDPLFQEILPATKLKFFNDTVEEMVKDGLDREAAGKAAAEFTNNVYGGINWEALGKSRDLQNVARMFILAPDWLRTNLNLGKGIVQTLVDPKHPLGKQYAKVARNLLGAYVAADVVNYTINGKHMFENEPGHALDIHIGKSEGKDRYIRPFGTAADFLRLPFDVAASAIKGDMGQGFKVLRNRASIPANTGVNLLWNQDDFGRPIFGKDVYGRKIGVGKQLGIAAGEISDLVTPPYVRAGIDYATGRSNAEQAAFGSAEMPIRFSTASKKRRAKLY